ncbi:MAG: LLM class flavin-dependent oxidoreductase [Hyphomicrobiales bacterium]|nr:MAG: LLM class flavin-dependent oxidoreductase [Hyphomicrobiales bacterium]
MTDYGHDLLFGTFVTPTARSAASVVDLAVTADRAGLDLVTFQDHPYQSAFLDTSTLLSFAAARTSRIRLAANVANLPLRPPAMLAREAATLDILSGGRFELGLGAGGFWDAIASMGGRKLTPGQGVVALREAIGIIREIWAADKPGGVRVDGEYYKLAGAKRGPRPPHDIAIWVGALKPKMLELTGTFGDGWLPSLAYIEGGPSALPDYNARIDDAAQRAGRDPKAVRRLLNIGGQFLPQSQGLLAGPPSDWAQQLTEIALTHGTSAFILASDDAATIERYAAEIAPAVRDMVAKNRGN